MIYDMMKRFVSDRKGIATIEFAFITPIMLFFMIGAVAAFDVVKGGKNYANAAKTIADLVTRQTSFSDAEFALQVSIAKAIMDKYSNVPDLQVRITSISNDDADLDSDGVFREIDWSLSNIANSQMSDAELAAFTKLPTIPKDETVILVEISGTYTPYIATDLIGAIDYYRYAIHRPRFSASVEYS